MLVVLLPPSSHQAMSAALAVSCPPSMRPAILPMLVVGLLLLVIPVVAPLHLLHLMVMSMIPGVLHYPSSYRITQVVRVVVHRFSNSLKVAVILLSLGIPMVVLPQTLYLSPMHQLSLVPLVQNHQLLVRI